MGTKMLTQPAPPKMKFLSLTKLVLKANKQLAEEEIAGKKVIREEIEITRGVSSEKY